MKSNLHNIGQEKTGVDVNQVAELASLRLTESEAQRMEKDLSSILAYVGELNELDTSSVEPMTQVSDIVGGHSALREDVTAPSLDRSRVMVSAPESDGAFFKVPKVIER
jgi:aspartyl-tRNA(Asn)/glutamyl-tRNA(Gln) amidotransferase subunit C